MRTFERNRRRGYHDNERWESGISESGRRGQYPRSLYVCGIRNRDHGGGGHTDGVGDSKPEGGGYRDADHDHIQ
jgi:hypothetical protein